MTEFNYTPFLQRLQGLYDKEEELSRPAGDGDKVNFCGDCRDCCSRPIRLTLCAIERKFLESKLSEEDYAAFFRFVAEKDGPEVCPLYDSEVPGCRIYEMRPLCCRFFGAFNREKLPSQCAYRTSAPAANEAAMQKISEESLSLRREFFQKQGRDFIPVSEMDFLFLGTVLFDRGDFSQSLQMFQNFLVRFACNDYALAMVEELRKILHSGEEFTPGGRI